MKNIAVVGSGYWGKNLVRNLYQLGALGAVCEIDDKILNNTGKNYKDILLFNNYADLLKNDSINGIVIATPASTHYELTKLALENNKNVLVEKPFTTSLAQAEALVKIAEEKKLVLMSGFTFLYNSAVRKIKEIIDSGALGEIRYVYSQRLNLGIVRKDINVWWNLAPHDVSIILYWLSGKVVSVNGTGVSFIQKGIDDVVTANIKFDSGSAAFIHVSWLDPNKVRKMTVVGSKKMVIYDDASPDMKVQIYDKGVDKFNDFNSFGQFQLIHRAGDIFMPKIDFDEPLKAECLHFLECIKTGKEPFTGGKMSLEIVRVLEAVQNSINNRGNSVELIK